MLGFLLEVSGCEEMCVCVFPATMRMLSVCVTVCVPRRRVFVCERSCNFRELKCFRICQVSAGVGGGVGY